MKVSTQYSTRITGTGMYVPPTVVTNEDLTQFIDTSDEWIYSKIGIRSRRVAGPGELPSSMATRAALQALETAKLSASDIDLFVVALTDPDVSAPATAALVQRALGASQASVFDIRNGCQGFMTASIIASQFIITEAVKTALVVGVSGHGTLLQKLGWRERTKSIFFGDGAGAIILTRSDSGQGILSTHMGNDAATAHALHLPFGGIASLFQDNGYEDPLLGNKMEGKVVFEFATREVPRSIKAVVADAGLSVSDIDFVILHQANKHIITTIMNELGLPLEKTFINIEQYGNMSEASVPAALHEALSQGLIQRGDHVVLCGFGAGMGWGTALVRW